jgi:hypothetical protein
VNVRFDMSIAESRQFAFGQLKPKTEWPISAKAGSEADRRKTTHRGHLTSRRLSLLSGWRK